jgi:hypothetical protein
LTDSHTPTAGPADESPHDDQPTLQEPRLWRGDGWTAKVIKNEDDDGWAVAMIKDGEPEPALVGPWTMGRDKKNPKPLDTPPSAPWSRRLLNSCAGTSSNCTPRCTRASP